MSMQRRWTRTIKSAGRKPRGSSVEGLVSLAGRQSFSRIMAERCRSYIEIPPPDDWDGVFEASDHRVRRSGAREGAADLWEKRFRGARVDRPRGRARTISLSRGRPRFELATDGQARPPHLAPPRAARPRDRLSFSSSTNRGGGSMNAGLRVARRRANDAVSRRPRRQFPAPQVPARRARAAPRLARLTAHALRAVEDEAIRGIVRIPGGPRPARHHRRRVPAHLFPHRLSDAARRRRDQGRHRRQLPQRRRATSISRRR